MMVRGVAAPTEGDGGSGETEEGDDPGWAELGQSGPRTGPSSGNSKENQGRLPRPPGRIEEMNRKGP
jgi:hypothetical protein